jgi:hypothetical protein
MGLKPKFTNADIDKMIREKFERIEQAILLRLQRIGEQFVTDARLNGSYNDITGNLRSSIGYVVLKNGEQYSAGGFEQVGTGIEGEKQGNKLLDVMPLFFPTGYVLIVVAGMNYAAAVESKGKDVLTGSSQTAIIELKQAMESIKRKTA